MTTLRDYVNPRTLRFMQETFSTAVGAPVHICGPDGSRLVETESEAPDDRPAKLRAPIKVGQEEVGYLALRPPAEVGSAGKAEAAKTPPSPSADRAEPTWAPDFLKLMAAMLASMCSRQKTLRLRIEELSTLYRLTAKFTGQGDLQSVLDTVTKSVVELMKAKACTIRLLNEDGTELLIKSAANIEDKYVIKGPIKLADSEIDQEAITRKHMVYVPDLGEDRRVLFPEGARAEGLVSCLAAPLVYRDRPVGVVRLYSGQRREFDRYERALLYAVAAHAASAIVSARLYQGAVSAANMKRQIRLAAEVQQRMFPSDKPRLPGFDISAIYVPCFELGGDFYDFMELPDGNLGVAVCDVVGKGIRASLLMASIRASLRAHASSIYDMSEILRRVNRNLCSESAVSDFATLFYGVINAGSRGFTYANAGHVAPLLFRDGMSCHLTSGGGVLGVRPDWSWEHNHVALRSRDVVLIYTDGLIEAMNFQDETFGRERLCAAAQTAIDQDNHAYGIMQHVLWEMRRHTGLQRRLDDLTMVAIKVQ